MIVKFTKAVDNNTGNYAYVCDINKYYFVYALLTTEDGSEPSYMINVWGVNANNTMYDIPAKYFTILEPSTPADWEEDTYDAYGEKIHIQSFPEMAHDKYFYDKLMNENPETVVVFKRYAKQYEQAVRDYIPTAS
jgi:hypothetical protein